jgi:Ni/Co efflux regulator RcnB
MNKILTAIALTGLIAAVPAVATAHDRDHRDRRGDSYHQRHDDARHHDHQHRSHRHRQYRVYDTPSVYYPAPRVAHVYVPAIPLPPLPPLPHVNIMWRIGH